MHAPSVAECKRRVSAREFGLWVAWNRISPIGPERDDLRMANLIWHIMNVLSAKPYPFKKCLFDFDPAGAKPEQQPQSTRSMEAVFMQYADAVRSSQGGSS